MNIQKLAEIVEKLHSDPEVTKEEAMECLMSLGDGINAGNEDSINCVVEIAGMACACDHPEMIRRFIKHVAYNGPCAKD